ncbi:MAG: response regulator [Planctomycetaceae bacterium]|jgi:CheY-like chemotaxis protein|nr:GAF domain-containing protein [Phycisphaerales bacterium]MCE2652587.1 response regulator [Planctomycetaceae bacterium]
MVSAPTTPDSDHAVGESLADQADLPSDGQPDQPQADEAGTVALPMAQVPSFNDRCLHDMVGALAEGLCLADSAGKVLWANATFQRYDDQTKDRISAAFAQAAASLLDPRRDPAAVAAAAAASSLRLEAASSDGRVFQISIAAVPDSPSGARRLAATVYDISAARRAQQKMEAIDRAGAELVRLDADLIRKMNMVERVRLLEQKIVKFAHDLLHFDHFAIRVVDERSSKLELVMSAGLPPEAMEVELFARREGNGISGYVAATGKSYICADTAVDPRYVIGINAARSSLTIPLRMSDKVIGIFNVESTQPNAFTEEDRAFGESFATHIALALHILDLLVVERSTTGQAVTGTVEGELSEPLEDIAQVAARLKAAIAGINTGTAPADPSLLRFTERILADVDSIRRRVKDVAAGPATILGAERSIADATLDPMLVGKRVLVADDDPRIRQIVRDVLRARGAEVVLCENGNSALAAIDGCLAPAGASALPGQERTVGSGAPAPAPGARLAADGRPLASHFDLLVSDIKMPDKTGYEIFSEARKVLPGMPVILMTGFGYDPHHSIVRASQEGLSCVLFKPFQAERLIEEVHKALHRKDAAAQAGAGGSPSAGSTRPA